MLLREPRKPVLPAVDQAIRLPCLSVSETCVLLNVARMVATPEWTFFDFFALTTFVGAGSSLVRSSFAEGAATFEGSSSSGLASALVASFFSSGLASAGASVLAWLSLAGASAAASGLVSAA